MCMCWEGLRGSKKVEIAVEVGDKQKGQHSENDQGDRAEDSRNELILSRS